MFQRIKHGKQRNFNRGALISVILLAVTMIGVIPICAQQNGTLPEGATVSALGRTSQVRSGGSFIISNVPSNFGRFRVRLIHPDGTTAESNCLTPVDRGTTIVPPLVFGALTPVSAALAVQSSQNIFTEQGQTAQLQVTTNLQGGGTIDITNSLCTTYISSNTSFVTVNASGLVTVNNMPLVPATLIVTVTNEGVVGTVSLLLNPGPATTDLDGDGMPNDWELRNGFDPTFPGDAVQDADGDGLNNRQEFQQNLAPRDPDTDRDGISDGANDPDGTGPIIAGPDLEPLSPEIVPPTCTLTSPTGGATLVEGETIIVRATATDNVGINRVTFTSNVGALNFTDFSSPYETPFVVPTGITQVIFNAVASDIAGNNRAVSPVMVNVIPDPLTTVTGRVLGENLMPVSGADVSVLGRTGSTGADGSFAITDVPTSQGNLIVTATFTPKSGPPLTGTSAPTPPVRGGTTNVGDILLIPALFEPDIGTLVLRQDDGAVTRTLPFSSSFYGNNYNQVFISNNGNLTFNSPDGDFTETIFEFLNRQPRISAFWDDLDPASSDAASGLYINDQLPGRLVVTWLRQLEFSQVPGPNTIQVILFSDGRIQYGYQGVASLDAIVGVSPGGLTVSNPLARVVDFSNTPFVSTNPGEALYEQFEVPAPRGSTDPPGSGQNSNRNNRFDLDGGFIVFTPKVGGGYDVRTILPPIALNHGTVSGTVLDTNGQPVGRAEVEILLSQAPKFRALINTDSQGRYVCANVPCGGKIIVTVTKRGNMVGQGAGEMPYGQESVRIDVHPSPPAPSKK